MARPKRRRKPRVVVVYRIPVFDAVARPTPLDEDRARELPQGHHREHFGPLVEGVGEMTFIEANRHRPDAEVRRSNRYSWELWQQAIHAGPSLADVMRAAVDAWLHPERVVWDRESELRAKWGHATSWRR